MKPFILVAFCILGTGGCAIPCEWALSEELCNPLDIEIDIDADIIGDTGVSLIEIPTEYQICLEGFIPIGTQICGHRGGEPTQVCSVGPGGAPSCTIVNEPLEFYIKQCLSGDTNNHPTRVINCEQCTQDLTQVKTIEDLPTALKLAPRCSQPSIQDEPPYPPELCGMQPEFDEDFCVDYPHPQNCVDPDKWIAFLFCDGKEWQHLCVCTQ